MKAEGWNECRGDECFPTEACIRRRQTSLLFQTSIKRKLFLMGINYRTRELARGTCDWQISRR